jgi:hypothetical protein
MKLPKKHLAFLDSIRNRAPADGQLSEKERQHLVDIVEKYPCSIDAVLMLMKAAWSHLNSDLGSWQNYYDQALQRENCWGDQDIVSLLTLGAELFGYDENDLQAIKALERAHKISPGNWNIFFRYVDESFQFSPEQELLPLIRQLANLIPDEGLAHYHLSILFHRLFLKSHQDQYKTAAIEHAERSLILGLDKDFEARSRAMIVRLS